MSIPEDEYRVQTDAGPNGQEPSTVNLDLTRQELRRGTRAGDRYVRVVRPYEHLFQRVGPGYLRATEEVSEPKTRFGRILFKLRHILIGQPLPTSAEIHERLTKVKALAIFASDAMSSVAYATEEILFVLILAGTGALGYSVYISLAIGLLLFVVAYSYRQTVFSYPSGGGSYIVSKDNLGVMPGLIAAAALMIDYVLTVSVSVSAGTAALTSAFEVLRPYTVIIALFFVLIMVVGNLRGIRESGNIFALPTYIFIVSLAVLIVVGLFRYFIGLPPVEAVHYAPPPAQDTVSVWLILTAFSAGSVAASGTEAISNGVPAFKPPESKNAATTLTVMAVILGVFFLGISFLASHFNLIPSEETIISQLGRVIFGKSWFYYLVQFSTMAILVLAANTSFADFPRLSSILARDGFMPHQFAFRGDRLAFSYGIVALGIIAGLLIFLFQGDTHLLIPLYAVGVFLAFTMSQAGMVLHHRRVREAGWQRNMIINGFGALLTFIVLAIAIVTKFIHGAWVTVLLIALLVVLFLLVSRHYRAVATQLALQVKGKPMPPPRQVLLVPLGDLNLPSARALSFAHSLSRQVNAIYVTNTPEAAKDLAEKLKEFAPDVKLVVLESPFRSLLDPLLSYIDALHQEDKDVYITVVIPEFVIAHWWERLLHNGTAERLKRALKSRPNVAVVDLPYQLHS